ncbi:unnamed protein product [Didymodactylos carnosus]|nr:unnamed protein product [Didymodactylos carnosus]CAF3965860.1 unnamed protein product [Didymodactylos carnosus]
MANNDQNFRLHSIQNNHSPDSIDHRYSDMFSLFPSSSRNAHFHQDTNSGHSHRQTRNMNDNSFRYQPSTIFSHRSHPLIRENNNSYGATSRNFHHDHRSNEQSSFANDYRLPYSQVNRYNTNEQTQSIPNLRSNHYQNVNKPSTTSQNDHHRSYSRHHCQLFQQQQQNNNSHVRQEYENNLLSADEHEQSHPSMKRRRSSNQSRLQSPTISSPPPLQQDHKRLRSVQENDSYTRQNHTQRQPSNEIIDDLAFQHPGISNYRPFSSDSEQQYQRYCRQQSGNPWIRPMQTQAHAQPQRPTTLEYNDWHRHHDISSRDASSQNRSQPHVHPPQEQSQSTREQHSHHNQSQHYQQRRRQHHHRSTTRRNEEENHRREMRDRLNFTNDFIRTIVPQLLNGHEALTDGLMMELVAVASPSDHVHLLYPATVTIEISEIISYAVPEDVIVGLSKAEIDALPIVVYSKPTDSSGDDDVDKCAVCLTVFDHGEQLKILRCKHLYHDKCIDPWLQSNSSCPVCRHDLREQPSD